MTATTSSRSFPVAIYDQREILASSRLSSTQRPQSINPKAQTQTLAATTAVHAAPIVVSLGCAAWFVFISWALFAADLETDLALAVVTIIFAMFLGGLTWGAIKAPNVSPELAHSRSFKDFLNGDVEIATGVISGREAMIQITALPLTLAIGGTVIACIGAFSH